MRELKDITRQLNTMNKKMDILIELTSLLIRYTFKDTSLAFQDKLNQDLDRIRQKSYIGQDINAGE